MLENKEDFKNNTIVYKLLCGLENSMKRKDAFAVSIFITKLKHHNISFKACDKKEGQQIPVQ